MEVAEPYPDTITATTHSNQQPVAKNEHHSVPATHRYVLLPTPLPICTYHSSPPKRKPAPAPITQDKEEPKQVSKLATNLRRSPIITSYVSPRTADIAVAALHQFIGNAFLQDMKRIVKVNVTTLGPEEVANRVVHPVTKETITKYWKLIDDPLMRVLWSKATCKEIRRLCQDFEDTEGTNTMRFLDLRGISNIPRDRVVTYARIVVDYRAHKKYPKRVRITAGGNLLKNLY